MGRKPPLDGIRVLDLTTVWSGPLAGRVLAELGADVILIEPLTGKGTGSTAQGASAGFTTPGDYTRDVYQILFHRNKRSLAVNLKTSGGQEVFRALAAKSDVVLENFGGPRVMQKFGFGYDGLREINPGIIYVGMPAHGMTGPNANHTGYGLSLEQLAGYPAMTGYEGDESVHKSGINYTDPVAGLHAAGAILAALIYRRRTGRGQLIDMSQRESGIAFIGEAILDWSMNHRDPVRRGNHDAAMCPHNVFRCTAGDDPWVFIGCRDDRDWQALCTVMARPELASDPRFETVIARRRNEQALDAEIERWTSRHAPREIEAQLQAAGVPSGAVQDVSQAIRDPYAGERGLYEWIDHPNGVAYPMQQAAWTFEGRERVPVRTTPMRGADAPAILRDLLGLDDAEIARLSSEGAIPTI